VTDNDAQRSPRLMRSTEVSRATGAAAAVASALDLPVDEAVVVHNSNLLALRLLPCDVFARVGRVGSRAVLPFEVDLAQQLARVGAPVAALDPRVEPWVYERDGFAMTLWTYYESVRPSDEVPRDYASALHGLHLGLAQVDVAARHVTDRVASAIETVMHSHRTGPGVDDDREFLASTLRDLGDRVAGSGSPEQLVHGEPHPGNVLATADGMRFIDLETCCRGPVEFDVAHTPEPVSAHYPDVNENLLAQCRGLVLAVAAAWRWDPSDELPNGQRAERALVGALRSGPPWPALNTVMRRAGIP
jgi:hypothetical protein